MFQHQRAAGNPHFELHLAELVHIPARPETEKSHEGHGRRLIQHGYSKQTTFRNKFMSQILIIEDYRHPSRVGSDLDDGVNNLPVQPVTIQRSNDIETIA